MALLLPSTAHECHYTYQKKKKSAVLRHCIFITCILHAQLVLYETENGRVPTSKTRLQRSYSAFFHSASPDILARVLFYINTRHTVTDYRRNVRSIDHVTRCRRLGYLITFFIQNETNACRTIQMAVCDGRKISAFRCKCYVVKQNVRNTFGIDYTNAAAVALENL